MQDGMEIGQSEVKLCVYVHLSPIHINCIIIKHGGVNPNILEQIHPQKMVR
jgi:hypothetical protein